MLNKDICKKCFNSKPVNDGWGWDKVPLLGDESTSVENHVESDTERWERGFVWCPDEILDLTVSSEGEDPCIPIHWDPPVWCPYKFEHCVSYGMHNDQLT